MQFDVKKYGTKKFVRTILTDNLTEQEAMKLESTIVDESFINRADTYNTSIRISTLNKPVYQFDLDGQFIKKWDSVIEACEYCNIQYNSMILTILNKLERRKSLWSFNSRINPKDFLKSHGTHIFRYSDSSLKLVDSFESIEQVSAILGEDSKDIKKVLNKGKSIKGYYLSTYKLEKYEHFEAKQVGKAPIYLYSLDGSYLCSLTSKDEIFNHFKVKSLAKVRLAILENIQYKDTQITFIKYDKLPPAKCSVKKRVGRFSESGELLEEFETITQAKLKYGTGVIRCLKEMQDFCKGYIFKFIS